MCYNCGCEIEDDPMGKGRISEGGGSLTETDIKVLAGKWDMNLEETKKNIYQMLKRQFDNKA